jgi:hypothetical protein
MVEFLDLFANPPDLRNRHLLAPENRWRRAFESDSEPGRTLGGDTDPRDERSPESRCVGLVRLRGRVARSG